MGSYPPPFARLHDLRHVHATTLLMAGVPVHEVAERLGHSGPDDHAADPASVMPC
ncbi:tyrosine-type recombinase/integrase [Kribbella qitaiheensis]|uniref:tyrosine-type recombinase/integrase n=1 Tax=Kribbella qitaiheensis TaxID=1544730 RepID=UPI003615C9F4